MAWLFLAIVYWLAFVLEGVHYSLRHPFRLGLFDIIFLAFFVLLGATQIIFG